MRFFIALLGCLLISTLALGSEVDMNQSMFKWRADKKIGDGHWGDIKLKTASVQMNKEKVQTAEFIMDLSSFTVDNLKGDWANKFINHVKSDDFFNVPKFPTAKLKLDRQTKGNTVNGLLTIKGKTNPVKIDFKQKGKTYTGKLVFDRTKFGIIYGSGKIGRAHV